MDDLILPLALALATSALAYFALSAFLDFLRHWPVRKGGRPA